MPRKKPAVVPQPINTEELRESAALNAEFLNVLRRHFAALGWDANDLSTNSAKYPAKTKHSISRSHAFGIFSEENPRRVTRGMCNLIAHEIAGYYEDRAASEHHSESEYSRRNLEFILHELLVGAGYAPLRGVSDRWTEIVGDIVEEHHREGEQTKIRVGYFPWATFADLDFTTDCVSRVVVTQLLNVLGIRAQPRCVPLKFEDLYSETVFSKVDLIAPFVSTPARLYTVASSWPISSSSDGEWQVGQNLVCATNCGRMLSDLLKPATLVPEVTVQQLIDRKDFWARTEVHVVKGGIPEMLVEFIDLQNHNIRRHETFATAVESAITIPQLQKETPLGKLPVLLCDELTARWVADKHRAQKLLQSGIFLRPIVFGLPPHRPEVVGMVNDGLVALSKLGCLEHIYCKRELKALGIENTRKVNKPQS